MSVRCGKRVPTSIAKKGKTKFGNFYYTRCKEKSLFPSGIILNQFLEKYHALILPIEKPKSDLEWDIIISSLNYKENDLKTIAILTTDKGEGSTESIRMKNEKDSIFKLSEYEKKAAGLNEQFYTRLLTSIVNYMTNEHHLSILELCGLPLSLTHIELLAKGLHYSKSIKILSLSRTSIKDEGLKTLAYSLRNSFSIMELHLAGCNLTHESAIILTELIKYQCLRREAEQWSNSLRPSLTNTNSHAELFGIPLNLKINSIKRLNICNNEIGDIGMNSLFEIITEDLGLEGL
ncbi:hypothetical protein BCR36DRAFT_395913 [Piromyces finnis]|uniref:RNI-like protein n=1 Tax=Piromyces finnis TaxID=1754191 RepID=A0A1Y1VGP4_9FUNG|nr:hypothetical protein BCR36DRAFT_395913 [Piromyces finnis]|eukprot:ORX55320.1 hypothetical protein BCR36DRAFT_395913 [Piromyces finnis]